MWRSIFFCRRWDWQSPRCRTLVRHVRSAMIEVLEAPFIRAARAHGIAERRVLLRYALPVAANPLISLIRLFAGNDAERISIGGSRS